MVDEQNRLVDERSNHSGSQLQQAARQPSRHTHINCARVAYVALQANATHPPFLITTLPQSDHAFTKDDCNCSPIFSSP